MKNLLFTENYVNNKLSVNILLSCCCLRHTKKVKTLSFISTQHFEKEKTFSCEAFTIETLKSRGNAAKDRLEVSPALHLQVL